MTIDDASDTPTCYEEFFRLHYAAVRGYCRSQTRDWDLAREAALDALGRVDGSWQTVQAMRRPIAFLITLARNYLIDQIRRNRARGIRENVHTSSWRRTNPELDVGSQVVDRTYLHWLMAQIDPQQATALWLNAYGFSNWETAEYLGCAVSTVVDLRKRGIRALQSIIEEENRRDEDAS